MDEEQQGFRRNRGVDDVLQVSRRIAEEVCSSRGQDNIKLTLYDIEKAYPRINREALWTLLHKRGAPASFIQVCQALHNHTQFHVKLEGTLSQNYEADRGLKEGCPSSPPLFNLYHQAVLHDFRARRKRSAESAGLTPGIEWKVFVDGRLSSAILTNSLATALEKPTSLANSAIRRSTQQSLASSIKGAAPKNRYLPPHPVFTGPAPNATGKSSSTKARDPVKSRGPAINTHNNAVDLTSLTAPAPNATKSGTA